MRKCTVLPGPSWPGNVFGKDIFMKIIIAGGTGFLGSPLAEMYAEEGHDVARRGAGSGWNVGKRPLRGRGEPGTDQRHRCLVRATVIPLRA